MRRSLTAAVAACALAPLLAASAAAAPVEVRDVTFAVENVNRTELPCQADGRRYTLRGQLIGPPRGDTVTVYLHEYSFGAFFWRFTDVPGYDHAAKMAAAGHTSLVIDRLGYDASDHPPGLGTCLGAQADMARQVVAQLRERGFRHVVLAGHSVGAVAAEVAAHQFDDLGIDALVVFALANRGYTRAALQESFVQGAVCTGGGEESEPGAPGGYAFYGQTAETWRPLVFHSAAPAVADAATARRNRDPCGDVASLTPATALNNARQSEIAVPVLLLWGGSDAVYEPGTAEQEAAAFSGSDDVTLRTFADAGHALLLEREAPDVTATLDAWLTRRGLRGTAPAPAPAGAAPEPPASAPAQRRARPPVSLPVQRRCVRGPRLGIRIHREPRPVALAAAVHGRTVLRLRGRRLGRRLGGKVRVRLPRRRGPVAVTVRVALADGDAWTATRRYRRCGGSAPPTR